MQFAFTFFIPCPFSTAPGPVPRGRRRRKTEDDGQRRIDGKGCITLPGRSLLGPVGGSSEASLGVLRASLKAFWGAAQYSTASVSNAQHRVPDPPAARPPAARRSPARRPSLLNATSRTQQHPSPTQHPALNCIRFQRSTQYSTASRCKREPLGVALKSRPARRPPARRASAVNRAPSTQQHPSPTQHPALNCIRLQRSTQY